MVELKQTNSCMHPYCYFNGEIKPLTEAALSLDELGVLRGYAVFDFLRAYRGVPFLFSEHFRRFQNSAESVGLNLRYGEEEVKEVVMELIEKNGMAEVNIRMVLTAGPVRDGMKSIDPIFYILFEKQFPFPKEVYEKGGKLITTDYERVFPRAKIANYIKAASLQKEKEEKGAVEILYLHEGKVLEASTSNIFLVKDGKVATTTDGVLHGITRGLIIRLLSDTYEVEEREVSFEELLAADEVFLTATNKEVLPIVNIEGNQIGSGEVGGVTAWLMKRFQDETKRYIEEHKV